MTFVVLFSTMSFSVAMHYCGDVLVDRAFFKDADSCGMEAAKIPEASGCEIVKMNCCSNEKIITEGQDELKIPLNEASTEHDLLTAPFFHSYSYTFPVLEKHIVPQRGPPPPLLVRNINILYQVFLI